MEFTPSNNELAAKLDLVYELLVDHLSAHAAARKEDEIMVRASKAWNLAHEKDTADIRRNMS